MHSLIRSPLTPFAVALLGALTACGGPKDPDVDDTDAVTDDTDAASDDTDAAGDDTDPAGDDTDAPPPPPRNTLVAGAWTVTVSEDACGIGFDQGLVGTVVEGTEEYFTLVMNETMNGQAASFDCNIGEDLVFICGDVSFAEGAVETCLYQSAMRTLQGVVSGGTVEFQADVSMSAVGQYCPPIAPCEATATANANLPR